MAGAHAYQGPQTSFIAGYTNGSSSSSQQPQPQLYHHSHPNAQLQQHALNHAAQQGPGSTSHQPHPGGISQPQQPNQLLQQYSGPSQRQSHTAQQPTTDPYQHPHFGPQQPRAITQPSTAGQEQRPAFALQQQLNLSEQSGLRQGQTSYPQQRTGFVPQQQHPNIADHQGDNFVSHQHGAAPQQSSGLISQQHPASGFAAQPSHGTTQQLTDTTIQQQPYIGQLQQDAPQSQSFGLQPNRQPEAQLSSFAPSLVTVPQGQVSDPSGRPQAMYQSDLMLRAQGELQRGQEVHPTLGSNEHAGGAQRSYDAEANPPGGQSIGNHQQHAPPSHAAAAQGGQQANVLGQRERADALSAEVQSLDRNEPIDHLLANLQGDNRPRKRQQPAYGQEYEPDNGQSTHELIASVKELCNRFTAMEQNLGSRLKLLEEASQKNCDSNERLEKKQDDLANHVQEMFNDMASRVQEKINDTVHTVLEKLSGLQNFCDLAKDYTNSGFRIMEDMRSTLRNLFHLNEPNQAADESLQSVDQTLDTGGSLDPSLLNLEQQ